MFQEMELHSTKLKKLLYFFLRKFFLLFQEEISEPEKQKFLVIRLFLDINLSIHFSSFEFPLL